MGALGDAIRVMNAMEVKEAIANFADSYEENVDSSGAVPRDDSVSTSKIQNGAVTRDKADPLTLGVYPFQQTATLKAPNDSTSPTYLLKAIKNIELYGADKTKQYYIQKIANNITGNIYGFAICNNAGTIVCELNSNTYVPGTGVASVTIPTVNSSGVYAIVWMDWSQLPAGAFPQNMTYAIAGLDVRTYKTTDIADGIVTTSKLGNGSVTRDKAEDNVLSMFPFSIRSDLKSGNFPTNSPQWLKAAIKNIELYGASQNDRYYIYTISKKLTNNVYGLAIRNSADVLVAQMNLSNYTPASGIDVAVILTIAQGISAKVWIDWSAIPDNTFIQNMTIANTEIDVRCFMGDVVSKIPLNGIPLNKLSTLFGNYLVPFKPDATPDTNVRQAIKKVELYGTDINKNYRIKEIQRKVGAGNEWSIYISDDTQDVCKFDVGNYTPATGIDVVFCNTLNSTGITAKVWIDWTQFVDGHNVWYYNYAQNGLDKSCYWNVFNSVQDDLKISLPAIIPAVVGNEVNIYFDNIISSTNLKNYQIFVQCPLGGQQEDRWRATPTSTGSYAMTITIRKNSITIIATATTTIVVKDKTTGTGNRNVIFMGESTTDQNTYTQEVLNLFGGDSLDITLLGTRGTAPNNHEGRSGWSTSNYINSDSFNGMTNAFRIGGVFDFTGYITARGYTGLDRFIITMGINDASQGISNATTIANYNTIINSVKAYDPNIKIGICLVIPPSKSQDAFATDNSQKNYYQKLKAYNLSQALIAEFDNRQAENIYIIPINTMLDTVNNMQTTQVAVNARNSTLVTRQSNSVHPATSGYNQMSDGAYFGLRYMEG
ncbi:MAG: hypothetical protein K0S61_2252 [Anaerocolumna sp.]|jgi:hypothetical protein|nr:hypothetical protein [Anaerocolumna sp.]